MQGSDIHTRVDRYTRNPLVYLSACVLLYLFIGVQYAALTPRWQVPDEPAHYNYIREIVQTGSLPVLDPGEYLQGYIGELTSQHFPPELSTDPLNYESWQPPLYYLLAAPIYAISNGDLLVLRLFSLALGAGVIIFAYLAVREVTPNQPFIAVVAAGFIAFIPQHIAMMAGINNDSLSEFIIAVGLWWIIRLNNQSEIQNRDCLILSAIIAAAFITKSHAYLLAPVATLMLLLRWYRDHKFSNSLILSTKRKPSNLQSPREASNLQYLILPAALIFIPALILGGLWWGRNIATYGWPDFMAAIRHDQVVSDQPRTANWVAEFGTTEVLRRFVVTTFRSFWGQFGWMGVVMPERYYWALVGFTIFLMLGYLLTFIRGLDASRWRIGSARTAQSPSVKQRNQSLPHSNSTPETSNSLTRSVQFSSPQLTNYYLLITAFALTFSLYLYYNLTYVQHQGRYLFPALIPISLAASLSLWGWGGVLESVTKRKIGWLVPLAALTAMAALSLFALYRFILPDLT
jgi:hypothetical protein